MSLDENMDLNSRLDLLARIPLFSEISAPHRELLASSSKVLTFESGEILFHQGDVGDTVYLIVDGEAEVVTEGPGGEIAIATIGRYQFIGEVAILIDVPRTATVVAVADLAALVMPRDIFYRMVTDYPEIAIEVMRELARRLLKTTAQVGRDDRGNTRD
ncbi:MAG: cyclic nucleotide-binding domain-containing protein [Arenicellales bacterium]